MSHVVSIKTELRDLAAVRAACAELGLTFKEGQKTIRCIGAWRGNDSGIAKELLGTSDHAIEVPGSNYDIGLLLNPQTGGYRMYFDDWGHNGKAIQAALGKNGETLLKYYASNKTMIEAKKKGWLVTRTIKPTGEHKLQITGC